MKKAKELLPLATKDIIEHENGRSARGKAPCPICKTICKVTACSDVNGIWWYCPYCGLVD